MKKSVINSLVLLFVSISIISACSSNSEDHPRIYVSEENKADFLESANNIEWKRQLIESKKAVIYY